MIQVEETKGNSQGGRVYHTEGISSGLKSLGGGGSAKCPMIVDRNIAHSLRVGGQGSYGKRQNWDCYEVRAIGGLQEHQHWRDDGLSPTLTEAMGKGGGQTPCVTQPASRIRRLTPVECERLQGLPDQYTALGRYGDEVKEVSDTQRYKGLGNAFTVNVIEAIVGRMLEKGCLE